MPNTTADILNDSTSDSAIQSRLSDLADIEEQLLFNAEVYGSDLSEKAAAELKAVIKQFEASTAGAYRALTKMKNLGLT